MNARKQSTANMVGKRFGRYLVLSHQGCVRGRARLLCRCDCGIEKVVMAQCLRAGTTQSCGCLNRDIVKSCPKIGNPTHRDSKSREYKIWAGIKKRCENPRSDAFSQYGGRGIKLSERWREYPNFLSDMGRCPPGMSIDRIDNNGHYESANCRWADRKTQNRNRRNNRRIATESTTISAADFQRIFGVPYATAYYRLFVSPNRSEWARRGMDSVRSAADLVFEDPE